tara:strand:- start:93 stop:293 length:201 start_codon:yes stop_codon:yes gene_type:complete
MKRFLLLALTTGLLSPIAANAESVWLVLTKHDAMEKIQMRDMEQCQKNRERWKKIYGLPSICFEGK